MEPSPPPFIVFRSPKLERAKASASIDIYQLALDFTAKVEAIVHKTDARIHLRDRLDRSATAIAMHVGQAVNDLAPAARRKTYRKTHGLAVDCSTILDILARRTDLDKSSVEAAQKLVAELLSKLEQLAIQSV
jgi:hypothetical protein